MDTRKLTYREGHEPHNQALIYDEDTGVDVAVTYNDDGGATAAELVKRWNAYPELIEALKECLGALLPPDMGGLTGAEHEAGCAEAEIIKARALLKSINP